MATPSAQQRRSLERELGSAISGVNGWGGPWDTGEENPLLQWPLSTRTFEQMRRTDSTVAAVLRAVTLPIRRARWSLDPAGARDEVVALIAEDLDLPVLGQERPPPPRTRGRLSWQEHLRHALLSLVFGHMPFEQVYRIAGDGADARVRLRKLAPRMPSTLTEIEVDPDGGLKAIKQTAAKSGQSDVTIGVDRLVMYVNDREAGVWQGQSLLRSAYADWLLKDRFRRVNAMTMERNGMGVPVIEAPPGAVQTDLDHLADLAQSFRAGERAGGSIPAGTKLRLVGVEGTLPDVAGSIRMCDEAITRSVLTQFLNLGTTQTGSRALGETFVDFFKMALDAIATGIADTATQHIVEDLVDLNWGESEPAPRVVCSAVDVDTDLSFEGLVELVTGGVITADDDLEKHVRDRYRLPAAASMTPAPARTAALPAARARSPRQRRVSAAEGDDVPSLPLQDLPEPFAGLYARRAQLLTELLDDVEPVLAAWAAAADFSAVPTSLVSAAAEPAIEQPVIDAVTASLTAALATDAGLTLRLTVHDGLVSGFAAGSADAAVLTLVGQATVDWDAEFADAVAAAGDLDDLWSQTDRWLADHVGVASRAAGQLAADLLEDGVTREDLLVQLRDVVGSRKTAAVLFDHAVTTALGDGQRRRYDSEGVLQVDFLTAADNRVDDVCVDAALGNPHRLGDAPAVPQHIACRCTLAPATDAIHTLLGL